MKAKSESIYLTFPRLNLNEIYIICHSDASLGNLPNGGSQGGLYVELTDGEYVCPIEWQSRRIRRTATSTMAVEIIA